jgi:hypothetical protein
VKRDHRQEKEVFDESRNLFFLSFSLMFEMLISSMSTYSALFLEDMYKDKSSDVFPSERKKERHFG